MAASNSPKSSKAVKSSNPPAKSTRSYMNQADMPIYRLSEVIKIAQALYDGFAGKSAEAYQLAMAVGMSPTSSSWEKLSASAMAYGLTDGAARAKTISLTPLGRRIVAPLEEGDELVAKVESVLKPRIIREFYEKYDRAKFPPDKIAMSVLQQMGVPNERLSKVLETVRQNGEDVGIVTQSKTGPFIAIKVSTVFTSTGSNGANTEAGVVPELDSDRNAPNDPNPSLPIFVDRPVTNTLPTVPKNTRVFISHGKNKEIVNQLKEILKFGKLEPIVAEEHETVSKPVPDKVLDDMRNCFAGIIHIESEEKLMDASGTPHHKLNANVLIEIGAALALYRRNVILLCESSVSLPSNLQGLYLCKYEGSKLEFDATMKLLKAFNDFQ